MGQQTMNDGSGHARATPRAEQQFLTLMLGGQLCGIPILEVRDVLGDQVPTPVPLAPPEIAGCLNLRGRIATAIDVRRQLGLPSAGDEAGQMSLVTEQDGELYALIVDRVIEVVSLPAAGLDSVPPTLPAGWTAASTGLHRVNGRLLVVLDVRRLLAAMAG